MSLASGEKIVLRPSLSGSWFLFCGVLLCLGIVILDRDPQSRDLLWYALSAFFLSLITHRAFLRYTLDSDSLSARGLFAAERRVAYRDIGDVEVRESLASRLSGSAHVLVRHSGGCLALVSQRDAQKLRDALLRLARAASAGGAPKGTEPEDEGREEGDGREGDPEEGDRLKGDPGVGPEEEGGARREAAPRPAGETPKGS
jgi:uncharacterized membrane protein YdbT with pleckstrin-like domain